MPAPGPGEALAQGLMLWALLSLGGGVLALGRAQAPFWRGFWWMTGVWGLVNGGIAYWAWTAPEPEPSLLARLLWLNAGLDLLYLALGVFLWTRPRPLLKGYGLAVLVQGGFLLLFDLGHALRL